MVMEKGHCQTVQESISKQQPSAREFLLRSQENQGILLPRVAPLIKDKQTAINIAEAILFSVYGKANILKQRPYQVYQIEQYWVLSGTLAEGKHGGVFEIALDGKDARVVGLTHGK